MDKYIVIKNGLVLTLDRRGLTGFFNIIIRNGKIFLLDYERKFNEKEFKLKNPDAEIIDAKDKLIMPGFFNSKIVSSYSLNKSFFRKCTYENINSWHSLKLVENYFSQIENTEVLRDLLKINYLRSLKNGEIFINEISSTVRKDFFDLYLTDIEWIRQYYNLTSYDYSILSKIDNPGNFLSVGFKTGEDINNYSLTSIKKNLPVSKFKLFIEASLSGKVFDSIKKDFRKSFINVLAEADLITGDTIISNPTHFSPLDIEILRQKKSSILISISDYVNLSVKKIDLDELVLSGNNIILGTGDTGADVLSEMKIFSSVISKNILSYENILRMAVTNPSYVFGVSNITGSIERNKSADLIFFDLTDIRNLLTLPGTDSESVCEFVIQNLNSKDISDVIIKGDVLIKERKEQFELMESVVTRAKEISQKIYTAGKYFEYREKQMMRERVDMINSDDPGEDFEKVKKEEMFVDMTETGEYVGEGEFTILGMKEEEFEKPRERDAEKVKLQLNLREIKSLETDLNLFEGLEDSGETTKPKKLKKKNVMHDASKNETVKNEINNKEDAQERISIGEEKTLDLKFNENLSEDQKTPELQKTKLKFGFKDEE